MFSSSTSSGCKSEIERVLLLLFLFLRLFEGSRLFQFYDSLLIHNIFVITFLPNLFTISNSTHTHIKRIYIYYSQIHIHFFLSTFQSPVTHDLINREVVLLLFLYFILLIFVLYFYSMLPNHSTFFFTPISMSKQ